MQHSYSPRGLLTYLANTVHKLQTQNRVLEHEKRCLLDQLLFTTEQFKIITGKNVEFIDFPKLDTDKSQESSELGSDAGELVVSTDILSSESDENQAEMQPQQTRQIQPPPIPFTITLRRNRRQPGEFKQLLKTHGEGCKCRSCYYENINKYQTRRPMKLKQEEYTSQEEK